jgi:multidrug transporter EmrE-like cation transporter
LLLIEAALEIIGDSALLLPRAELAVIFALGVGVAAALLAPACWWFFDGTLSLQRLVELALVVGAMILLQK